MPLAATAADEAKEITFIVTQDFHGRIDQNTVQWAGTVEELRAAAGEDRSIFLSAGDNFGNSLYASSVQGELPTVSVLNALGLEATAAGNGEYFIGYDDFMNLADNAAEFPHLAANVVDAVTGEVELESYVIREVDGVRIGIIGVVTADTQVQFPSGDPLFLPMLPALNAAAEEIDELGLADVIVALVHDGGANSPPATLESELAAGGVLAQIIQQSSPLIDVLFTAHTHNQYVYQAPVPGDPDRTRPVIQAGAFGSLFNEVVLTYDPVAGEVIASTARIVPRTTTPIDELVENYPRVERVKEIVDEALAYAEEQGITPAGQVTQPITTAFSGGSFVDGVFETDATSNSVRTLESALGTLVANMFRDVQQDQEVRPQFGITLPNFIRSDLMPDAQGNIPIMKIIETFGIRDSIMSADITGAQLKQLFEEQWQRNADGLLLGYIQLAVSDNLTFTYDDTRELDDRITSITIDGEPVDLSDTETTYRMAFTGALTIGIVNFHTGREFAAIHDSGLLDVEGFARYFAELSEEGPVAPDFRKHGVRITGLDENIEFEVGDTVRFDVSSLNLTSIGAPEVTSLEVRLNGVLLDTIPVVDGATQVSFVVPAASGVLSSETREVTVSADASVLELVLSTGATVRVPIAVSQEATGNGGDGGGNGTGGSDDDGDSTDTGSTGGKAGDGQGDLSETGSELSLAPMAFGGLALLAGAGLLLRGLIRSRRNA